MSSIDSLLAPVRDDAPCGDDPSSSGVLFDLETAIQGKPETQFSAGEEPDWKQFEARAREVAGTTKDLRVAALLTAALLRTRGIKGLRDGFKLIRGYLETYWGQVYPLLDASDNNDPTERINALTSLAAPIATDGDLLRIIVGLRKAPMISVARAGVFTLEHYLHVKGLIVWPATAGQAPTSGLLDGAVKEAGSEVVTELATATGEILADLAAIEAVFKQQAGPSLFPTFDPLRKELKLLAAWLPLPGTPENLATSSATADGSAVGGAGGPAAAGGPAIGGVVRSRDDVIRALDAIMAYYRSYEPSSPAPFLLHRVKRIVQMNFMELITELTPETIDRIMMLTGPLQNSSEPKS